MCASNRRLTAMAFRGRRARPTPRCRIGIAISVTVAAALCVPPATVLAAPDEIQVYVDDMNDRGAFGVELHTNYVSVGSKSPSYPGELPSHHVLQLTPEFSYGITPNLEAGMYFPPVAVAPGGEAYENGMRLRLKYVAPRDEGQRLFAGFNTEFGYSARRVADSAWNLELRPIVGYRDERWLVAFNPIVDYAFSAPGRGSSFEPALKVGRLVAPGWRVGFEDYASLGPLRRVAEREHAHTLYAALDVEVGRLDLNLGVGRGFGETGDRWVVKMIVGLPFDLFAGGAAKP